MQRAVSWPFVVPSMGPWFPTYGPRHSHCCRHGEITWSRWIWFVHHGTLWIVVFFSWLFILHLRRRDVLWSGTSATWVRWSWSTQSDNHFSGVIFMWANPALSCYGPSLINALSPLRTCSSASLCNRSTHSVHDHFREPFPFRFLILSFMDSESWL